MMQLLPNLALHYHVSSPEDNPAFDSILLHATSMFESRQKEHALQVEEARIEERGCAETIQRLSTRMGTLEESRRMRRRMLDDNRVQVAHILDELTRSVNAVDLVAELDQRLGGGASCA